MKIAMFAWESLHSFAIGGIAVHVSELAAALERRGHEVHVFTRKDHWQSSDELIHSVWYHRCEFDLDSNFVQEIQNMCLSLKHRFGEVNSYIGGFDIVHAHDWLTSNAMAWVKEGHGNKSILTMHSSEYGRCGNNFYDGQSQLVRDHERHGTFMADRVITVSNKLKEEICWMYEIPHQKVDMIYNGCQYKNFDGFIDQGEIKSRFGVHPYDPVILFAGRLTTQKGPDLLMSALPSILRHHHNAKVIFAGDGDMRGHLEHMAWETGVSHAVRFAGHQKGEGLNDLFKACDFVCVPSRNEPFGIVILEAWSCGKPVVATVQGGPAEFVWHDVNGIKVYCESDSIAWGCCELLRNPGHAQWLGSNGRSTVESAFSWDTIAADTEEVYKRA